MGQTVKISKPVCPVIEFETVSGKTYKRPATFFNHLMGEALASARAIEGIDSATEPKTIHTYDCFRIAIAESLGVEVGEISEETAFLIAGEQARLVEDLKKTCVSTVD